MSWQSELACWMLRRQVRPKTLSPVIDVADARALAKRRRPFATRVPTGWRLRECYGQGDAPRDPLRGEWLEPVEATQAAASSPTLLYFDGGGYYFCTPATHRPLVFALAARAHARTFSSDYRLAPEHPFPAAHDDALAAYAVLFSPWTDLAATGATLVTNDGADPMFAGVALGRAARLYVGDASAPDPYVSPLYADAAGLPPLLIQAGSTEVLLDDSRRFAERAQATGVDVELQGRPRMPHVWQMAVPFVPEARRPQPQAQIAIA
ncbi:MAG: Monoterpene epsilon-lactone hydrolase [Burkholderia gladioli]|nr:MAG: Monoterpene epsilon-lactone hydrolase [Burkholderia gladioli]